MIKNMRHSFRVKQPNDGLVLVTVLVLISILMIAGIALLSQATAQFSYTANDTFRVNALYVAEAGIEQSLQQLNQNDNFSGYSSPQTFFNSASQGNGTFTVSVVTNSDGSKTLTSTGKVYRYNQTTPISTRIVKVTAVGTQSPGYSVESGPGGLILTGSAAITNSTVFVNGKISLSGAAHIGTSSNPLNVYVANDVCPSGSNPGTSYPSVCSSGQPISFSGSTAIYGSVCATGQTSSANIQGGSTGQGLEAGCTTAPASPPTYNRSAQISAVTTTGSGSSNTYVCNSWPFNRSWPGNLELTGNVTVGSSCNVDVNGNVYIDGNLTIDGAAKLTTDNSVGTTRPVFVVDGTITIGGSAQMLENSSGTGIEFISFASNDSACNVNGAINGSGCTTITGTPLYNTQSYQTINVGGAVSVPGMIFDAYWGEVTLGGSGNIGSAIGQTVNMSGAGTITFGTSLGSGTETWTITSYQQEFH